MFDADIDLCAKNNGGCDVNADCTEVGNTKVKCECHDGYTGDGLTCTGEPSVITCVEERGYVFGSVCLSVCPLDYSKALSGF